MKNNKNIKSTYNFFKWLHNNRTKIILILFFIVLPIALVMTAYIGAYTTNKKVHFDTSLTKDTVFVDKFTDLNDIDAFELNISWDEIKKPAKNEEDEYFGGYYKFLMYYTEKVNYQVISVNVTPLLQTDWVNVRSLGTQTSLTETARTVQVSFNEIFPIKPLWFVTVDEPNLYLKIDYTFTTASNNLTKTIYVIYSLNDLNPRIVT